MRTPCQRLAAPVLAAGGSSGHAEAGCATTLKVQYGGLNRIVTNLKIVAVDHRTVRDLNARTSQYVDELVAEVERKEREKAGAVAAPRL